MKSGIVTWETQETDYPRTRPDLPNHEPRGCSRGASYSWYLYSASRVKTPLVRGRLLKAWRELRESKSPTEAWTALQQDQAARDSYVKVRRKGRVRPRQLGRGERDHRRCERIHRADSRPGQGHRFFADPRDVDGQLRGRNPLSQPFGRRVHVVLYDWYCDLPPASPMTWGEQTDVPESADWYNSGYLILWGSNVPQTRTPDAHFYTEARYRGTKSAVICPDYSEAAKFGDIWLNAKQGTDAALAMAFGHVILREFHVDRQVEYFADYCRRYSDLPDARPDRRERRAPRTWALPSRR